MNINKHLYQETWPIPVTTKYYGTTRNSILSQSNVVRRLEEGEIMNECDAFVKFTFWSFKEQNQ